MIVTNQAKLHDRIPLRLEPHCPEARLDIWERFDGKWRVTVLVMHEKAPRWRERYGVTVDGQQTALACADNLKQRWGHECLACGSPLLLTELQEHQGVCCYSCAAIRERNGGRWPA